MKLTGKPPDIDKHVSFRLPFCDVKRFQRFVDHLRIMSKAITPNESDDIPISQLAGTLNAVADFVTRGRRGRGSSTRGSGRVSEVCGSFSGLRAASR